jgi:hypothetical protein
MFVLDTVNLPSLKGRFGDGRGAVVRTGVSVYNTNVAFLNQDLNLDDTGTVRCGTVRCGTSFPSLWHWGREFCFCIRLFCLSVGGLLYR